MSRRNRASTLEKKEDGNYYLDGRPILNREVSYPELILRRADTSRAPTLLGAKNRHTLFQGPAAVRTFARATVGRATFLTGIDESDDGEAQNDEALLTDSQRLATSSKAVNKASLAMMFCVLAEGIQEMSVMPNYPMMVTPGAHPDSFASTSPFGITAAQYTLCAATAIAMMISNLVCGNLADKYGQRRMVLALTSGTICCNISKYFARSSFWAFTALCFVNGLFGGNVAVTNSYISLIFHDDRKKVDKMIGYITATSIASFSIGGLLTILFQGSLFMPLIVAAGVSCLAAVTAYVMVLDPGSYQKKSAEVENLDLPEKLDKKLLLSIIFGALMDNIGSLGITPLAFSPVLYQKFFLDFVEAGTVPIMSEDNYRMAYTMISVTIVPAASISTILFQKIGPAKSCVFANVFTGGTIIALILIATANPTKTTYAAFLTVLYFGSPFTFISNISTGPMLDRITPLDKKGAVHGINNAIFKFSAAFGNLLVLWICVGVSFFAAISNLPLLLYPRLGTTSKKSDERAVPLDEDEIQELLDQAEHVPLKDIFEVNETRAEVGLPFLQSRFGSYSRDHIDKFGSLSADDLKFIRGKIEQRLHVIHELPEMKELYLQSLNARDEDFEAKKRELEQWVSAYLHDSGYFGYFGGLENPQLFKSLFMRSFPRLNDGPEVTERGMEGI